MGAQLSAQPTAVASPAVNLYGGTGCKTDVDCTNERKIGVGGATVVPAITDAAAKAKTCCLYNALTKDASGTDAEIALAKAEWKKEYEGYGLKNVVGYYNKVCFTDYPAVISNFYDKTKYEGYDSKTGTGTALKANGAYQFKVYCDGGANALAFATIAAASATISMY